jgi:hypothetical protein
VFKKRSRENIQALNIKGKKITNFNTIDETFNKHLSGIADIIHKHIKVKVMNGEFKATNYMTYMSDDLKVHC